MFCDVREADDLQVLVLGDGTAENSARRGLAFGRGSSRAGRRPRSEFPAGCSRHLLPVGRDAEPKGGERPRRCECTRGPRPPSVGSVISWVCSTRPASSTWSWTFWPPRPRWATRISAVTEVPLRTEAGTSTRVSSTSFANRSRPRPTVNTGTARARKRGRRSAMSASACQTVVTAPDGQGTAERSWPARSARGPGRPPEKVRAACWGAAPRSRRKGRGADCSVGQGMSRPLPGPSWAAMAPRAAASGCA